MVDLAGRIVTPEGLIEGVVRFGTRIEAVTRGTLDAADRDLLIVPGFIDLHVHGGGGADAMRGELDVRGLANFHARHGTTALTPTTVTAPDEDLVAAAEGIGRVCYAPGEGEARVLGLHLEGPFISPKRLGAQPPFARPADRALLDRLLSLTPVRILTFAPEEDPGLILLRHAAAQGVRCQIGHSDALYETCLEALAAGAQGFTHLFNAMRPFTSRDPGVAGAALAAARWAEIIPDLIHVSPGGIEVALRAIPNLYAVTDAMEAAGCADGFYRLGSLEVTKVGNEARLADGTLAGSLLTMDRAFANLVGLGLGIEESVRRCATLPADHLALTDRGRLTPGAVADIVVLDPDLGVARVFVEGGEIET